MSRTIPVSWSRRACSACREENAILVRVKSNQNGEISFVMRSMTSGSQQTLVDIAADERFLIVENEQEPFSLLLSLR